MTDKIRKLAMKSKYYATMACNDDDKLDYQTLFENHMIGEALQLICDAIEETKSLNSEQITELCDRIKSKFD